MPKKAAAKAKESDGEKIGFHKGSLAVLAKEREEMMRILQIVEQLMQMHMGELQRLGVDLSAEVKKAKQQKTKKPPIEDLI